MMPSLRSLFFCGMICVGNWTAAAEPAAFSRDVAPILRDHSLACHGPQNAEGGYRVDSYEQLIIAGDSDEAPIALEAGQSSELLRRLTCDESERMPAESEPLTPEQIAIIRSWIEAGGKFDGREPGDTLAVVIPAATYAAPPTHYAQPIPITAVCFSPSGEELLVGGYHEVTVWNIESAELVRRIPNLGQRIFSLTFSPDQQTLAVGCGEPGRSGELRLVDFASGAVTGVIARVDDVVLDAAFRPESRQLAVASADGLIRIFDLETLSELHSMASHADWVNALAWSDDGKRLVSASRDKTVKVFDGETGDLLTSYAGHQGSVHGVTVLADGKQAVSAGADQKLHRWNLDTAKRAAELNLGAGAFKLVRAGRSIFVPCDDGSVRHISAGDSKAAGSFQGHGDWALSTHADPRGKRVASGAFNGEVRVWNLDDGQPIQTWIAQP